MLFVLYGYGLKHCLTDTLWMVSLRGCRQCLQNTGWIYISPFVQKAAINSGDNGKAMPLCERQPSGLAPAWQRGSPRYPACSWQGCGCCGWSPTRSGSDRERACPAISGLGYSHVESLILFPWAFPILEAGSDHKNFLSVYKYFSSQSFLQRHTLGLRRSPFPYRWDRAPAWKRSVCSASFLLLHAAALHSIWNIDLSRDESRELEEGLTWLVS